jgi:hypothetical protein
MVASRKKKRSNDVSFHHTTPHIHFWFVPLMFDDLMGCLATPNLAVIRVHQTIQVKHYLVRKHTDFGKHSLPSGLSNICLQNVSFLQ